jgi:hypothetical protein
VSSGVRRPCGTPASNRDCAGVWEREVQGKAGAGGLAYIGGGAVEEGALQNGSKSRPRRRSPANESEAGQGGRRARESWERLVWDPLSVRERDGGQGIGWPIR